LLGIQAVAQVSGRAKEMPVHLRDRRHPASGILSLISNVMHRAISGDQCESRMTLGAFVSFSLGVW
jgi:hypothetical protein